MLRPVGNIGWSSNEFESMDIGNRNLFSTTVGILPTLRLVLWLLASLEHKPSLRFRHGLGASRDNSLPETTSPPEAHGEKSLHSSSSGVLLRTAALLGALRLPMMLTIPRCAGVGKWPARNDLATCDA